MTHQAGSIRNQKGFTLVEMLVAMLIGLIAFAGVYQIYISVVKTTSVQEQVGDMQQNIRISIDQIVRELRLAGLDPANPGGGSRAIEGETSGGVDTMVGQIVSLSAGNFFQFRGGYR